MSLPRATKTPAENSIDYLKQHQMQNMLNALQAGYHDSIKGAFAAYASNYNAAIQKNDLSASLTMMTGVKMAIENTTRMYVTLLDDIVSVHQEEKTNGKAECPIIGGGAH